MTGAVVITWGAPVRGREAKGFEVFGKALAHFEALAKEGRIYGHKEYFAVTGNTGRVGGFMIVEGPLDELFKIQTEEPTRRLMAQSQAIVDAFSVQFYAGGSDSAVQQQVTTYVEEMQNIGVM